MPNFKMMSYGELQKHLEDRGFSVNINETWQDLYDAAKADFEIEKRQYCSTKKIVLGERS